MSGWLLNIIGIIFVGVLFEIILPDGKTNNFIKHVFTIFLLFTIISPISSFLNNNFTLNTDVDVVDENFIYVTNLNKISELEKTITNNLEKVGIKNVSVIINSNIFETDLIINSVYVDVTNKKLENNVSESEYKNEIKKIILKTVNVDSEDIIIYG